MPTSGVRVSRPLELLTGDEIYDIHTAALDVLRNVGVAFEDKLALKILDKAGCEVDFKTEVARFPESLVRETTRKAPGSVDQPRLPRVGLYIALSDGHAKR